MSVPARLVRDLPALASEINAEHEAAEQAINDSLQHARRCGELLNEAKAQCQHGEWGAWLAENFRATPRTAQGYMKIASANAQRVSHLSIRDALAELAEPRETADEPEPAREDGKGTVAAPTPERTEMQDTPDLPRAEPEPNHDARPEREVVNRRPYTARLRTFVRAAMDLGEPTDEEVEAIPANDMMLDRLTEAYGTLGRILNTHGRMQ